jgi:hypothetical protein
VKRKTIDFNKAPRPGHVFVDIMVGWRGQRALGIGDGKTGRRIGPDAAPWDTEERFEVSVHDLREALKGKRAVRP